MVVTFIPNQSGKSDSHSTGLFILICKYFVYRLLRLKQKCQFEYNISLLLTSGPQHWNMSAWAGGVLSRAADTARYTCRSSRNPAGPPVNSTTKFAVECKCSWNFIYKLGLLLINK